MLRREYITGLKEIQTVILVSALSINIGDLDKKDILIYFCNS